MASVKPTYVKPMSGNDILLEFRAKDPNGDEENRILEETKKLLDAGADVNAVNANGSTRLHQALFPNHLRVISFLLERGARLDILNQNGHTPLSLALQLHRTDAAILLIFHGADRIHTKGSLPLYSAASYGSVPVISLLLGRSGKLDSSKLDSTIDSGATPLFATLAMTKIEAAMLLIRKGANVTMAPRRGNNPIQLATTHSRMPNRLGLMLFLLEQGAKINPWTGSLPNKDSYEYIMLQIWHKIYPIFVNLDSENSLLVPTIAYKNLLQGIANDVIEAYLKTPEALAAIKKDLQTCLDAYRKAETKESQEERILQNVTLTKRLFSYFLNNREFVKKLLNERLQNALDDFFGLQDVAKYLREAAESLVSTDKTQEAVEEKLKIIKIILKSAIEDIIFHCHLSLSCTEMLFSYLNCDSWDIEQTTAASNASNQSSNISTTTENKTAAEVQQSGQESKSQAETIFKVQTQEERIQSIVIKMLKDIGFSKEKFLILSTGPTLGSIQDAKQSKDGKSDADSKPTREGSITTTQALKQSTASSSNSHDASHQGQTQPVMLSPTASNLTTTASIPSTSATTPITVVSAEVGVTVTSSAKKSLP